LENINNNYSKYTKSKNSYGNDYDNSIRNKEYEFKDFLKAINRRKKIVISISIAVFTSTLSISIFQRIFFPIYIGDFSMLISDPLNNNKNNSANSIGGVFEQLALNSTDNDLPTLIELLKSPILLNPISKDYGIPFNKFSKSLQISTPGGLRTQSMAQGVLRISFKGENPRIVNSMLVSISKAYLKSALDQKQQRLSDGLIFLNNQSPKLEGKNKQVQKELSDFRERNQLIEPTVEGQELKTRLDYLENELDNIKNERVKLNNLLKSIENGSLTAYGFKQAITTDLNLNERIPTEGVSFINLDLELLDQYILVKQKLAIARTKYLEDSEIVKGLKYRVEQIEPTLKSNQISALISAREIIDKNIQNAKIKIKSLKEKFEKQPKLISEYKTLQQKALLAAKNLEGLSSAKEKFQLEIAQRSVPWSIIAPPKVYPVPVSPDIPLNLSLSLIFGPVLGLIVGLIRDKVDHVYHSPDEVKENLNLPLLAELPYIESFVNLRENNESIFNVEDKLNATKNEKSSESYLGYQRFFYQEAFRGMYTSIKFINTQNSLKILSISSCIPSEGKSLISTMFAKTISELGLSVLLIDTDLRKPQVHARLGLDNLIGFSNLLIDSSDNYKKYIQSVPTQDNFDVITSGSIPPDPTRLLGSDSMKKFIETIRSENKYDYVILDTSPILSISDSTLIAQYCDSLLMVVSLNNVDMDLPLLAKNKLKKTNRPLIGFVSNQIKKPKTFSKNRYYGYSNYSNNYGYNSNYISYYADNKIRDKFTKRNLTFENSKDNFLISKIKKFRNKVLDFISWLDR
tara:strand:+ start:13583 stop:15985 length:2403 start_codon:yes stop_codon:yes gene_type:complete